MQTETVSNTSNTSIQKVEINGTTIATFLFDSSGTPLKYVGGLLREDVLNYLLQESASEPSLVSSGLAVKFIQALRVDADYIDRVMINMTLDRWEAFFAMADDTLN